MASTGEPGAAAAPVEDPGAALTRGHGHWAGSFPAMAGPCEVLVETDSRDEAERVLSVARDEAWRIERKFSRYRDDNIVHAINSSQGRWVRVDAETERLLDFADTCHRLSGGRFDVTSGVLRYAWRFDATGRLPSRREVERLLPRIGWRRVQRRRHGVRLPPGMELDFGVIGKEYAVDHCVALIREVSEAPVLVNFGGDLAVSGPRRGGACWRVGVEVPEGIDAPAAGIALELARGGLATSGDARRYLIRDGVRFGHVLDPRTGWPVPDAPRSVTVAAGSCTHAGMLATLALLQGADAERLLEREGVASRVLR